MADTPNPKCSKCKCYWKPDETDIKSSGLQCKTCKKCRGRGNKWREENADILNEYCKGFIYILKNKNDDDNENIYVGSTNNYIKRMYSHKMNCNNPNSKEYNKKVYQFIRANGGWEEWDMIIVEEYPCNNKEELKMKEDEIMLEVKSKLNDRRAKRTHKEYNEDNKEKIAEQKKEYYKDNKERIVETHKEWREKHIFYQTEYMRKYNKERVICDICAGEVCKSSLPRHKRGLRCINKNIKTLTTS